jgi:hypothetical protein
MPSWILNSLLARSDNAQGTACSPSCDNIATEASWLCSRASGSKRANRCSGHGPRNRPRGHLAGHATLRCLGVRSRDRDRVRRARHGLAPRATVRMPRTILPDGPMAACNARKHSGVARSLDLAGRKESISHHCGCPVTAISAGSCERRRIDLQETCRSACEQDV